MPSRESVVYDLHLTEPQANDPCQGEPHPLAQPGRTVGLMTQWARGQNAAPINMEGGALKKKEDYRPALNFWQSLPC